MRARCNTRLQSTRQVRSQAPAWCISLRPPALLEGSMPDPDYEPSPMSTRRYIESDRVEGTAVYDARGHRVGVVKRLIIEKVSGQGEHAKLWGDHAASGSAWSSFAGR